MPDEQGSGGHAFGGEGRHGGTVDAHEGTDDLENRISASVAGSKRIHSMHRRLICRPETPRHVRKTFVQRPQLRTGRNERRGEQRHVDQAAPKAIQLFTLNESHHFLPAGLIAGPQ